MLEKENEDSIVTGGTDSDECSDETVHGIEVVAMVVVVVIMMMKEILFKLQNKLPGQIKLPLCKPTGQCKFTGQ